MEIHLFCGPCMDVVNCRSVFAGEIYNDNVMEEILNKFIKNVQF